MPQPDVRDVHVSTALTNVSVAYMQDESAYIATQVFPVVPVQHQADVYYVFSKDDFFRDEAQLRADATESAGSGFNLSTQGYQARVWAIHKDVGDQLRRNADPGVDIDVVTTRFVTQRMMIRRERYFVASFLTSGLWGTDVAFSAGGTPGTATSVPWSDDSGSDPFTDISNGQQQILLTTGVEANTLVLSYPVYMTLRKHPLIIDRIKYTTPVFAGNITPQLLATAFDVDRVLVSRAVYNSSPEGQAGSYSFIMGNSALLLHTPAAPSLMTPAAGYTFSWQGYTGLNDVGVQVYQIPMPTLGRGTVRIEAEMAFDMRVVANQLGYFFNGAV